jgi:hypothetical protein
MVTCPSCGRENEPDARFCAACGAELASTPSREARKTVTVLFADVTGSTALGEQLDAESLRRTMARYFDTAVEKFIGDAVMAVFGVPLVHEDDALRAVRAAAELREAMPALNEQLGDADAQAGWRRVRAKPLARMGDLGQAETIGREPVAIAAETDLFADAMAVTDLGEVLRLAGRLQEAATTSAEALGLFEQKGVIASATKLRALLADQQIEA